MAMTLRQMRTALLQQHRVQVADRRKAETAAEKEAIDYVINDIEERIIEIDEQIELQENQADV